jgi:hypothetical protein
MASWCEDCGHPHSKRDSECQFQYEKESEISEDLKDSLSMVPLVEPIYLPLCGHIFSLFFIRKHLEQNSDCPLCRTTVPDVQQVLNSPSPVLLRNVLGKLSVTCPCKCGRICQRMNLASHLQICTNALVSCPYCAGDGEDPINEEDRRRGIEVPLLSLLKTFDCHQSRFT